MRTWLDISSLCLCSRRRDIHQWMKPHNTAKTHSWTSNKQKQETFVILFAVMDSSICGFFVFQQPLILLHGKMPKSGAGDVSRYHQPGGALLAVLEGLAICGGRGRQHSRPFRGMKGGARWRWKNKSPFWLWTGLNGALTSFFIAKKRRSTIN